LLQIVNNEFLRHVREKRVSYVHGDTLEIQKDGVRVNVRQHESKPKDPGEEKLFSADVIVFATGYKKPGIDFLPKDLFPEGYEVCISLSLLRTAGLP
jgi:dimethylaniline monooxygenase (N-oxide forming)